MPNSEAQQVGDLAGLAVILGVLQQWLPVIAAIFAIVWYLIRFYEWYRFRIRGRDDKFS